MPKTPSDLAPGSPAPDELPELELESVAIEVDALPELETVAVSPAVQCPDCLIGSDLGARGALGERTCATCSGTQLDRSAWSALGQVLALTAEAQQALLAEAIGKEKACADCGKSARTAVFRRARIRPCTVCGSVWIAAGGLHLLTAGRHGTPAPNTGVERSITAPVAVAPRAKRPWIVGGLLVGTAAVGAVSRHFSARDHLSCPANTHQAVFGGPTADTGELIGCFDLARRKQGPAVVRDGTGRKVADQTYRDDLADGTEVTYYGTGQKHEEGMNRAGGRWGSWTTYSEQGVRLSVAEYKKGVLDGLETTYMASGLPLSEGTYAKGLKEGVWRTWNDHAESQPPVRYHLGEVVSDAAPKGAGVLVGADLKGLFFGGQRVEWWNERLAELRDNPAQAELYARFKQRAAANGLAIGDTKGKPTVEATPDLIKHLDHTKVTQ